MILLSWHFFNIIALHSLLMELKYGFNQLYKFLAIHFLSHTCLTFQHLSICIGKFNKLIIFRLLVYVYESIIPIKELKTYSKVSGLFKFWSVSIRKDCIHFCFRCHVMMWHVHIQFYFLCNFFFISIIVNKLAYLNNISSVILGIMMFLTKM